MFKAILIVLTVIITASAISFAATIHVPADYPTIQEAIDAAVNGDTVLVKPGTYTENIDFKGKAITVMGEQGAASTIIDGNQADSVVVFLSGEGADSILAGFTVTNGSSTYGCGIYCRDASPTIVNNTIVKNINYSLFSSGGGVFCLNAGDVNISDNLIRQNQSGFGGGICCYDSSPIISYNAIKNNKSTYGGGGVGGCESTMTIVNNCFTGNSGGAIDLVDESTALILNNTLSSNAGSGIVCEHSTANVKNTILWYNEPPSGPEIRLADSSALTIGCSNVMGGKASVIIDPGCTLNWGPGMIDSDPLFVDPANDDLHISFLSPCRGSGDNSAVTELYDFEGDPRITYGTVDMGADEFYTHFYTAGNKKPGGSIEGKFIGLPGASPVGLFIGSGILPTPVNTMWGEFWLQAPWILIGPLGAIPSDGIMILPTTLPPGMIVPVDIPMQALIGLNADSLTNLCVLEVR